MTVYLVAWRMTEDFAQYSQAREDYNERTYLELVEAPSFAEAVAIAQEGDPWGDDAAEIETVTDLSISTGHEDIRDFLDAGKDYRDLLWVCQFPNFGEWIVLSGSTNIEPLSLSDYLMRGAED